VRLTEKLFSQKDMRELSQSNSAQRRCDGSDQSQQQRVRRWILEPNEGEGHPCRGRKCRNEVQPKDEAEQQKESWQLTNHAVSALASFEIGP
jgi:hypothetical protein